MNKPKFELGSDVWYITLQVTKYSETCPDCMGQKYLTVILGDGSKITIDCGRCSRHPALLTPTGQVDRHKRSLETRSSKVIKIELTGGREKSSILYATGDKDSLLMKEEDLFLTQEEASAKMKEISKIPLSENMEQIRYEVREAQRDISWRVNYLREEIERTQKNLVYFTRKLDIARELKKGNPSWWNRLWKGRDK